MAKSSAEPAPPPFICWICFCFCAPFLFFMPKVLSSTFFACAALGSGLGGILNCGWRLLLCGASGGSELRSQSLARVSLSSDR